MKQRYWLYLRRRTGTYYLEDSLSGKRESLKTTDRRQAERLRDAKNEAAEQPMLNLALGRAYLGHIDPAMTQRTWQDVMNDFCLGKRDSTQERNQRAFASKAFNPIRSRKLVETGIDELLNFVRNLAAFNNHIFHRVHNHAVGMGWIAYPIIPPKRWPRTEKQAKRAITWAEQQRIVASEQDSERRLYYEFLWETGSGQTDAALMTAANVDWQRRILSYQRKKTGERCDLVIGSRLEGILKQLPSTGFLFPKQATLDVKHRAAEFCRRCRVAEVTGVSLHSYRYAWAERAEECGYPERFAQKALGHASKAVHRAYARGSVVSIPSMESFQRQNEKVVPIEFSAQGVRPAEQEASNVS